MIRKAHARWDGGLKDGKGVVSGHSSAFRNLAYTFDTRFEDKHGTNPEELIVAAEAACFSMALSAELGKAGLHPQSIETDAELTLEMLPGGPTITSIHLKVNAHVPGADKDKFAAAAETAKKGCPVSRVLNAKITLESKLVTEARVAG